MNNIKSFSFYKNYYELLKYLPDDERLKLYDTILEFMFEDKEPQLEKLLYGIWINLKMPLETSKNNSGRGGRPKITNNQIKTEKKPNENRIKTEKKTNNISYFLFLISNNNYKYIMLNNNIYNKVYKWLEYKEQRKEKYTEIGLKSLLTQIEKNIDLYGENEIIELIEECISNNYKGIIFDKLKNKKTNNIPNWFNENNDSKEMTDKEKEELENILNSM